MEESNGRVRPGGLRPAALQLALTGSRGLRLTCMQGESILVTTIKNQTRGTDGQRVWRSPMIRASARQRYHRTCLPVNDPHRPMGRFSIPCVGPTRPSPSVEQPGGTGDEKDPLAAQICRKRASTGRAMRCADAYSSAPSSSSSPKGGLGTSPFTQATTKALRTADNVRPWLLAFRCAASRSSSLTRAPIIGPLACSSFFVTKVSLAQNRMRTNPLVCLRDIVYISGVERCSTLFSNLPEKGMMKYVEWMLWQDGDTSKSPEDILQDAISYYQDKYGCPVTHIRAPLGFPKVSGIEGVRLDRVRGVSSGHLMLTHNEGGHSCDGPGGRGE